MIELPAGVRVEHTVAAINPHGMTLVIGQGQPALEPIGNDRIQITTAIHWLMSMHLTPPAMRALKIQLDECISVYEQNNGPITVHVAPPPGPKLAVDNVRPPSPPAFDEGGLQDRRHLLGEYPQVEPAPSPSSPPPSPGL